MGLFRNIGRKVEEFKKTSEAVAADEASYECAECGKRFYTSHDGCPECGGRVVSLETESKSATNEDEAGVTAEGDEPETAIDDDEADATTDER